MSVNHYRPDRVFPILHAVMTVGILVAGPSGAVGAAFDPRFFSPPPELATNLGSFRSPLVFNDNKRVATKESWRARRLEIVEAWHDAMTPWPELLTRPRFEILRSETAPGFHQHRVRIEIAEGQIEEGWFLVPDGTRPFPAVLVPFYEPETSIGLKGKNRDFARQLTGRGFVTLSIGSPGGDARQPDPGRRSWQPLSYLAYIAANCHTALAQRPEVDSTRIGVVGHSYGGKWAMFAGAFHEKFACVAVSDPGVVWDETRPNVNYWEPWYLGRDPLTTRRPGVITTESPRTGAYQSLFETGHDLTEVHALIAPRPFLVSAGAEDPPSRWPALNHLRAINSVLGFTNRVAMTNRATHDPTPESNEQLCQFFEDVLGVPASVRTRPR
jgi:hypothetical protein